jgi:hypothetical protein
MIDVTEVCGFVISDFYDNVNGNFQIDKVMNTLRKLYIINGLNIVLIIFSNTEFILILCRSLFLRSYL